MTHKKVMLVILDGFGYSESADGNAIRSAKTNFISRIYEKKEFPFTLIKTSGMAVGLPEGQMGNSEVGHTNIGAGRVVYQDFTLINKEIEDGSFYKNEAINSAINNAKKNNTDLHLLGLISDGGVHSHINHVFAILELCKKIGHNKVFVHAFMDGRDTSPNSGVNYLKQLETKMREIGVGEIATVCGRYYAMDRDKRWDRVKLAYDMLTLGEGEKVAKADIEKMMKNCYANNETDEFIKPKVICGDGHTPLTSIKSNDSVIFFNFRADRTRQMSTALNKSREDFKEFERKAITENLYFVTMTQYDEKYTFPVAYKPRVLKNILGEIISKNGLKQLRIAETEKYAHVTYFFNGGEEKVFEGEERALIPSPKVATYDLKPEMSAYEVTEELLKQIEKNKFDLIVLNYANCDMVGHTGIIPAAQKAVETIDACLPRIIEKFQQVCGGTVLVTADHGNSEKMIDYETRKPFTEHTTFEVPFIVFEKDGFKGKLREGGKLCDIAPTILKLMNIEKPAEMEGSSLIV
ncbi:MAG: 2,3-bisphosphoglycerate-independent phosphoglycerate mutase [Candidatus Wallbacteria bacterium]